MSYLVVPKMRMSSIMQSIPGKPSRSECILHSPLIIKSALGHSNAEDKFIVAVPSERGINSLDFSANGTCQNLLFASSLENTVAPVSCPRMSLTFGRGWCSLSTHRLSGFRSMQTLTPLFFFFTTTMPVHQGVGCCTFDITP